MGGLRAAATDIGAACGVGHFAVSKAIRRADRLQRDAKRLAKILSQRITNSRA